MWTLILLHVLTVYLILRVKSQQFCLKSFKNWIVFMYVELPHEPSAAVSWCCVTWHDCGHMTGWIEPYGSNPHWERERAVPAAELSRSIRRQEWHLIQSERGSEIRIRWVMNWIRLTLIIRSSPVYSVLIHLIHALL